MIINKEYCDRLRGLCEKVTEPFLPTICGYCEYRKNLPALLDEVERLNREVESLHWFKKARQLMAEVEKLTNLVEVADEQKWATIEMLAKTRREDERIKAAINAADTRAAAMEARLERAERENAALIKQKHATLAAERIRQHQDTEEALLSTEELLEKLKKEPWWPKEVRQDG